MNSLLEQLHDIEGIDAISMWPLAIGWWVLIALCVLALCILIYFIIILLYTFLMIVFLEIECAALDKKKKILGINDLDIMYLWKVILQVVARYRAPLSYATTCHKSYMMMK